MTDTTTTEGQVPDAMKPTEISQAVPANPDPEAQVPDGEAHDPERARALIQKLRQKEKLAEQLERRVKQFEDKEREAERAKLSEIEQERSRRTELETELKREREHNRNRLTSYEVKMAAQNLNIVDPDAALKLVSLEYGDDGEPIDIEGSLKQLIEDKPYLVRTEQAPQRQPAGNPTNPATRAQTPGTRRYTASEIADRAFYVANRDDITRALREGRIDS
jgi:hypothetical protein